MDRGYNRTLAIDLFDSGRITDKIVEGQQKSDEAQAKTNMRLGYMGHLTLIAEEVVKFTERHPPEFLSKSVLSMVMASKWVDYVEHTLAETRERDNAILGGVRPDMSVGPRQAVINSLNAAQGFGNGPSVALANAGLTGGAAGLDSIDLINSNGAPNANFSFTSNTLQSGFGSSSDEEDEEMEDETDAEDSRPANSDGSNNVGRAFPNNVEICPRKYDAATSITRILVISSELCVSPAGPSFYIATFWLLFELRLQLHRGCTSQELLRKFCTARFHFDMLFTVQHILRSLRACVDIDVLVACACFSYHPL